MTCYEPKESMEVQAKYEMIKQKLSDSIEKGVYRINEKIPSENELCRQYNTSRITVRKAIDELVLTGKLYRVQGVGTFVASAKEQKRKKRILVIASDNDFFLGSRMMSEMMRGVDSVAYKNDATVVYVREPQQEEGYINAFMSQINFEQPDGIIYFFYSKNYYLDELKKMNVPIVFTDTEPDGLYGDVVVGEDYKSAYEAAKLMISEGLTRIGFFCIWDVISSVTENRYRGMLDALKEAGIPTKESWMMRQISDIRLSSYMQEGSVLESAKQYLRENPELEAVIAMNDNNAWVLHAAAASMGIKIPENLKMLSYGNYSWSNYFNGGITSYDQNFEKYGKEAAKLILKRLDHKLPEEQQRVLLPKYKLFRRNSF